MEPLTLAIVLTGLDVLERNDFRQLEGAKVALITNHTGRTIDGRYSVDLLHEAPNLELVSILAPEHGIRGEVDAYVEDDIDRATGLRIHSLYSPEARANGFRPTLEQLGGADTIVFDIQDIGTRFYTYVSQMGFAMETAAEHGLRFVVLDRPNPIGGVIVEGPLADLDRLGHTAYQPIPLRHGMTAGELAGLFKEMRGLDVDLEVIECEGWRRGMWWDETGLSWVDPSPNMRSLTQALLYPGIALVEASNVSVGRGTDTPFEHIGAPWIDGQRLAAAMNAKRLPGFACYPVEFTPSSSKYEGEKCGGVYFIVTDREAIEPIRVGFELAYELNRLFPEWDESKLVNLVQNAEAARLCLEGGWDLAHGSWAEDLERFKALRAKHLLY